MSNTIMEESGTTIVRFTGPAGEGDRRRYEITSTRPLTREELRAVALVLIQELDDRGDDPPPGCAWCGG